MSGEIVGLSSRNHYVMLNHRKNHATVKLDQSDVKNFPDEDFVLYIKDNKFNEPSAVSTLNNY